MTTRLLLTNLSNVSLKVAVVSPKENGEEGVDTHSEKLVMNGEPNEFTISQGRYLMVSEAESADAGDNKKSAALDAAAKEPQALTEQRNPQVQLTSNPVDPNTAAVTHETPMANTKVETIKPTNELKNP